MWQARLYVVERRITDIKKKQKKHVLAISGKCGRAKEKPRLAAQIE